MFVTKKVQQYSYSCIKISVFYTHNPLHLFQVCRYTHTCYTDKEVPNYEEGENLGQCYLNQWLITWITLFQSYNNIITMQYNIWKFI